MGPKTFLSALFPASPAGELLADKVEQQALRRVRLRLPIVLACMLLGGVLGFLFVLRQDTVYRAVARVRIGLNGQGVGGGHFKVGLRDELSMLAGDPFHSLVFHQLDPRLRSRLAGMGGKHGRPAASSASFSPEKLARRTEVLGTEAIGRLSAKPVEFTSLVEFSYRSPDPALAINIVNTATQVAQEAGLGASQRRVERSNAFLEDRLVDLQKEITQLQAQQDKAEEGEGPAQLELRQKSVTKLGLAKARRKRRKRRFQPDNTAAVQSTFEFDDDTEDIDLQSLASASERAHLLSGIAEARLRLLGSLHAQGEQAAFAENRADPGKRGSSGEGQLAALRLLLTQAESDYAGLNASLGSEQPQLLSSEARIRELQSEIAAADAHAMASEQAETQLARRNMTEVDKALNERKAAVARMLQAEVNTAILELELAIDLAVYADMEQALRTRRVNAALYSPIVDVVDEAHAPLEAISRPFAYWIVMGGGAGLALGLLLTLLHYLRHRFFWSIAQVEHAAGMTLGGILPSVLPLSDKAASAAEYAAAIRDLSGNVQWLDSFQPARVLLFTSSVHGEGSSSVAADCAAALADSGARVLLLDANLHRSTLRGRFGVQGRLGLSHVLNGHSTVGEALQPIAAHPGLTLLATGPLPPRASQLLQGDGMVHLLAEARQTHDFVVVHAAPTIYSSDSAFLAHYADLLLLVARFGRVDLGVIERAAGLLAPTRVSCAGLVVNGVTAA